MGSRSGPRSETTQSCLQVKVAQDYLDRLNH
jgi:hypothetical protein